MRKRKSSKRGTRVSGEVSDDSIGSASDLRAREEEDEEEEEKEGAGETETINDSVLTCGSSAYHAETESMALEETITKCPRVPEVPETEGDMLFVGHSYGEKPLLADDELDTEDDNPPPRSPPLLITIQEDSTPKDVFALAPFQKPDSKKKVKREINITPDSLLQLSTPSPPMLVAISPIVAEGSLVDLSDGSNDVAQDVKDSGFNTFSGDYDSCKTFPIFPQDIPHDVVVQEDKDMFGSLPFIRHSNNPFTDGSEIVSSNDGLYHKTSIVIGGNDSRLTSVEDSKQAFAYSSLPQVSNVFVSSTAPTNSTNQDLFGSVPFDNLPKTTNSHYFVHRPTTLPVTCESLTCDVTNHLSQQMEEMAVESTADNSSPEALMLPEVSDLDSLKTKKEHHKLHSLSEKCKYHLIEETRKSPLQSKHKIVKSSITKKTGKISKKIGKVSKTGFSNWSFEDFPSDDAEEAVEHSSSVPFEVLRDEKTPVENDRKYGSLKSRTNPFS